ncbi:DinB family protein [Lewinella sp. W8]|uniref:DinB family protein n=1 Tax=Lewinella sp. W8 TaxID=2528208 RepID=UPI0010686522|nr:DinB family protein [Lewinella sp. W8]MTB53526.1 DinB family protein [Lewinella sp. W8]
MKSNPLIHHLLEQLQEIQDGKLWMGDSFQQKLDSISEEEAFVRPLPELHSVAELLAHLTAWKKDALLKVQRGTGELTSEDAADWPTNQALKDLGWKRLREENEKSHHDLLKALRGKEDAFLEETYQDQDFKGTFPLSFALNGILHHDLYHLGQMGIVIKLLKLKGIH